jgi:Cu/Ag efflux protein CusF
VTLHHGPIASLGWPAMTMTFKAAPDALRAAKPGQTVKFTLQTPDNLIVAIQPQ